MTVINNRNLISNSYKIKELQKEIEKLKEIIINMSKIYNAINIDM